MHPESHDLFHLSSASVPLEDWFAQSLDIVANDPELEFEQLGPAQVRHKFP